MPDTKPVNAAPDTTIATAIQSQDSQQQDQLRGGEEKPSLDHFIYTNPNTYTIQTHVSEPESPSPILAAWSATQLNPDYLTPYHPSHHKNIHNWSQMLLDQIHQKSVASLSTPESTEPTKVLGTASQPNSTAATEAFQGISIAPSSTNSHSSSSTPAKDAKVEKHFLFQVHHHQQHAHPHPHPYHTSRPRLHARQKHRSKDSTRSRSSRSIRKSIARFFRRLFRSLRKRGVDPDEDTKDMTLDQKDVASTSLPSPTPLRRKPTPADILNPTEPALEYLSVSDEDDHDGAHNNIDKNNAEPQQPQPAIDSTDLGSSSNPLRTVKLVPKMLKVIDKFRHHARNQQQQGQHRDIDVQTNRQTDNEKTSVIAAPIPDPVSIPPPVSSSVAATAAAAKLVSKKKDRRQQGPRLHPKLLELYEMTDRVLGVGTFATVKEIKLKSSGQSFALKIILKKTLQGRGAMLDTEIAVLSKVRHMNCVSLLEMFETEDAVYLVTDLAAGGELFDRLLAKGYYTEGDAARLVREILLGVEYLHSMEIVHRDLKPENLLFHDKSENARLMITDFGLSKILTSGNDVLMTACGTPGYVAPEVLEQIGHGKPVDMWSVGVIAYTLLCGYTPFWGENQPALFENIMAGEYHYEDEYWKDISPLAKHFIDTLLVRPAEKRSTAIQALSHPWFRAMLDQDMSAPASPTDSINLLPGVRKNFNARKVFKKAVRAVGILKKIQGGHGASSMGSPTSPTSPYTLSSPSSSSPPSSPSSPSSPISPSSEPVAAANGLNKDMAVSLGEDVVYVGGKSPVKSTGLSFHDVVHAAVLTHQGAKLDAVSASAGRQTEVITGIDNDSDDQLARVDAVLEDMTARGSLIIQP
ncbi:Calcium/calmodulin-dependent protein kinase type 1 [Mortierella polycephala]|uniref:Calcium/calmodulin-dependent protein kinase type 1 n=1 Tax=Mortierella polycephala TaxID=41804 RepID=A0A9P6U9K6_9FUNG|nr:Calcium/calmodulin-dependent protein kinase type 1 [Mortierella polycephala]